jgi:tRNA splicing endonuclease
MAVRRMVFRLHRKLNLSTIQAMDLKEENLILMKTGTGFRLSLEKLMTYEKFIFVVLKIEQHKLKLL